MNNKLVKIAVIIIAISLVIVRIFFINNQSTPDELKKAYAEAVQKVEQFGKNKYSDSWTISIWNGQIIYSQCPEYSFRSRKEHCEDYSVYPSKDGSKIILYCYESCFYNEGSWLTAGTAYKKYREFKNASDFRKSFDRLLKKRQSKKYSSRLDLSSYYPWVSLDNLLLSFHDDQKKFEYHE